MGDLVDSRQPGSGGVPPAAPATHGSYGDGGPPPSAWQAGDDGGSGGGELHYYWRLLYGRRRLLAATAMVGLTLAAFSTFRQPRLYQAQATVEFKQVLPPGKDVDLGRRELYVPAELARRLLTTKLLAARIIKSERQRGDNWFGASPAPAGGTSLLGTVTGAVHTALSSAVSLARKLLAPPPPASRKRESSADLTQQKDWEGVDLAAIARYYSHITIRPVRLTSLVDVLVTHTDPVIAAHLANDHAQGFVDLDVETKITSLSEAQGLFGRQLDEVRNQLQTSRQALTNFQLEHGIVSLPKDSTTLTRQSLQQINKLLTEAEANRIGVEATYRNAAALSLEKLTDTLPDAGVQAIRDRLLSLQARYQANLQQYGERHPDMISMRAQIESARGTLKQAAAQVRTRLKAAYEAALAKETELRHRLETLSRAASKEDRGLVQLLVLQRDVQSNEQLYASLLDKAKEADLLHGSVEWTNVNIVDRAVPPTIPSYPRTRRNLMLGLLLGLLAGTAIALVIDRMDTTVHTPEELTAILGLPTIGMVPNFQQLSEGDAYGRYAADGAYGRRRRRSAPRAESASAADSDAHEVVTLNQPASLVSEAYRSIRTNLLFSSPGSPPRTVLITSSQPGEGKTVTTVNLAVTLALSGSRVLVIDADLRRPACHQMLRTATEPGLSSFLSGQCELDDAICRSPLSPRVAHTGEEHGVFVLPSGRVPPNPAELLGSKTMQNLLDTVREQFGFVLIDSPPVLPVTDSVAMSTLTDAVLLIVREGRWGRDVQRKALAQLHGVHARTLGAILNCVNLRRGGSSNYYYRHYYGYRPYYQDAAGNEEAGNRAEPA